MSKEEDLIVNGIRLSNIRGFIQEMIAAKESMIDENSSEDEIHDLQFNKDNLSLIDNLRSQLQAKEEIIEEQIDMIERRDASLIKQDQLIKEQTQLLKDMGEALEKIGSTNDGFYINQIVKEALSRLKQHLKEDHQPGTHSDYV